RFCPLARLDPARDGTCALARSRQVAHKGHAALTLRARRRNRKAAAPNQVFGAGFFGCLGFFGSLRCLSRLPMERPSFTKRAVYAFSPSPEASACRKSAIRSSRSSIPTETRTSES